MAQGSATSADVPGKYDCAIDGKGYMLLGTLEPSIPFRTHRAIYGSTATFIERSNISGSYGDNQQDFFLTEAQSDWSLGEQQRFFRQADADSVRRYWSSIAVDISVPGQVTLQRGIFTTSTAGSIVAATPFGFGGSIVAASSTNVYEITAGGAINDLGAHGAGATNGPQAITTDSASIYVAGATSVRRWSGSYSTFSSISGTVSSLTFANNTLYGMRGNAGSGLADEFIQFDSAGNITSNFQWKNANGGAANNTFSAMLPFGGKILILRQSGEQGGPELWLGDSSGVAKIANFPVNFLATSMCADYGVVFIAGRMSTSASVEMESVVFYYANGNIGLLWRANNKSATNVGDEQIVAFQGRILFTDETNLLLKQYDIATGGVVTLGAIPSTGSFSGFTIGAASRHILLGRNNTTSYIYPTSFAASTASVTSSLFDFDNTLTKLFRSIKVDFVSASDGNGGSVDIAYQIDGLDGSYTSLQTGATSGTEYVLPTNTTGRAITILIGMNKGTSTLGPILKRVYVRAAPQLQAYRTRTYVFDLSGIGQKDQVRLADGTYHTLTGHEQAANLITALSKSSVQVSDRFCNLQTSLGGSTTTDSFTAILEPAECEIYDTREGWDNPQQPGAFVAKITVREI